MALGLAAEGGKAARSHDEEAVGGNAQRGMMVKAAPAAAFVVAKPEFLLEVLVIALDPPAPLGLPDEVGQEVSAGRVENQYLVGSASPFGHSIRHHSSARGSQRLVSP